MQYINSEGLLIDTIKNESRICGITNILSGDAVALLGKSNTVGASSLSFMGNNNVVSGNSVLFGGEYNVLNSSFLLNGSYNSLSGGSVLFNGSNNALSGSFVISGDDNTLIEGSIAIYSDNNDLSSQSISFYSKDNIAQNKTLSFYTENSVLSAALSIAGKNNTVNDSVNIEGSNNILNNDSLNVLGNNNTLSVSSVAILNQSSVLDNKSLSILSNISQTKNNSIGINTYNSNVSENSFAVLENEGVIQSNSFGYGGNNNVLRLSSVAINSSNSRLTDNSFSAFTANSVISGGSVSIGKSNNSNLNLNSLGICSTNVTASAYSVSINNSNSVLRNNSFGVGSNNVKVSSSAIEMLGVNNVVGVSSIDLIGEGNVILDKSISLIDFKTAVNNSVSVKNKNSSITANSIGIIGVDNIISDNSLSVVGNSNNVSVGSVSLGNNQSTVSNNSVVVAGSGINVSNSSIGLAGLNNSSTNNSVVLAGTGVNVSNNSIGLAGLNNSSTNNSVVVAGSGINVSNNSIGLVGLNNSSTNNSVVLAGTGVNVSNNSVVLAGSSVNVSDNSVVINSTNSVASLSSLIVSGSFNSVVNNSMVLGGDNVNLRQRKSVAVGGSNVNVNATDSVLIGNKNVEASDVIFNLNAPGYDIVSIGGSGNKLGSNSITIGGANNQAQNSSVIIAGSGNDVGSHKNVAMIAVSNTTASEDNTAYLPRTFFKGDVTVNGNLSAGGNITSINTLITTEWVARLVNYLQASAVMYADQRNNLGNYNIAEFRYLGSPKMFVTKEGVGINTNSVPAPYVLTINGAASGTNLLLNDKLTLGNGDTNLYRGAADLLKTDDSLNVGTLDTGSTNTVVTHSSNTLQQRNINPRVWDTSATFLSGTPTNNYLVKSDGLNKLVNSSIFDNGTSVGIGTTSFTTEKLNVAGSVRYGSMAYPVFEGNIDFGADAAGTWRKLITASLLNAHYSTIGFVIEITDPKSNHIDSENTNASVETIKFNVACVRTAAITFDNPDVCYVSGPVSGMIRAVKLSTGNYEIQIAGRRMWQEYYVKIYSYAGNYQSHTINYYGGDTATVVTTQPVYNSSGGKKVEYFDKGIFTGIGNHDFGHYLQLKEIAAGDSEGPKILFEKNAPSKGWSIGSARGVAETGFGIYEDSSNASSGTTRLYLAAGGNIGIGTTTPQGKLHIRGGSVNDADAELFIDGSSGWTQILNSAGQGSYNPLVQAGDKAIIYSSGIIDGTSGMVICPYSTSPKGIRIDANGNVGIGAATPGVKLDVDGNGRFTSNGQTLQLVGTGHSYIGWFPDGVAAGRKAYTGFGSDTINYFSINNEINDGTGHIVFSPGTNANVGIGTTSPTQKFHVIDSADSGPNGNALFASTGGNASIRVDAASTNFHAYQTLSQGGVGKFEFGIVPTSSDFYINPNVQSGSAGASIYIKKSTGLVGIGTTAPGYLLDVYNNSDIWHAKMGGDTGILRIGGQTASGAVIQAWNPATNAVRDLYLQRDGGRVGVGTNNPLALLHAVGDPSSTTAMAVFDGYSSTTPSGGMWLRGARGSIVAPSAVLSGDRFGFVAGGTYGATGFGNPVVINFWATQNHSDTARGSYIGFETTPLNSITRTERLRIEADGTVKINTGSLYTAGNTGWYNETHGGGWYMSDSAWVRSTNEKNVWTGNGLLGSQGGLTVGHGGYAPPTGGAMIRGNVGLGDSIVSTSPYSYAVNARLHIRETDATTNARMLLTSNQNVQLVYSTDREGVAGWSFGQDAADSNKFKIASYFNSLTTNTRLTIDASGRVGIGTTTPDTNTILDVRGGLMRLGNTDGYGYIQFGASATSFVNWHIGSETADNSFRIYDGGYGAGTERIRIDSSGRFNIFEASGAGTDTDPTISIKHQNSTTKVGLRAVSNGNMLICTDNETVASLGSVGAFFYKQLNASASVNVTGGRLTVEGSDKQITSDEAFAIEPTLRIKSANSTSAASINFVINGLTNGNIRFGMDTDGKLKVGGQFLGGNKYEIYHSGNYANHTHNSLTLPSYFKSGASDFLTVSVGGYSSWWNFQGIATGVYNNTASNNSAVLSFANSLGKKINLYSTSYGIGIDSATVVIYKPTGGHFAIRNDDYTLASAATTPYMLKSTSAGDLEVYRNITAGKIEGALGPGEPKISALYDDTTFTQIIGQDVVNTNFVYQNKISNIVYSAIRANGTAEFRGSIYAGRSNNAYNNTEVIVVAYYDSDNYTLIRGSNAADSAHVFNTRVNNVTYAAIQANGYIYSKPLVGSTTRSIAANSDGLIVIGTSDERLKENISTIDSALAKVGNLRGVYYNWKNKKEMGAEKCIGLIAQEVQKVIPEATYQNNDGYYGVHYAELVSVLINAVKELKQEVDELRAKLT